MSDQRLSSAPSTRNEITLIQRSSLDVAPCSRPARGRVHVTVQQRRGLAGATLSLIRWAMTYRQVRGRAASLSPKSRPKIPLPAQSALCLPRNPLPAARTVRKTHRFLNGGRVPQDGQAGAAIGCSVSATVFSHGTPSLCTHRTRAWSDSWQRSCDGCYDTDPREDRSFHIT